MTPLRFPHATILTLAALLSGCGAPTSPPDGSQVAPTPAPEATARTATFEFDGVVRQVEPEGGTVSIDHEDIPDLMPAMLMDFRLDDPGLLDDVIIDDEVRGTLEVDYAPDEKISRLELVDLVVTRPAPPRPPSGEPLPPPARMPVLEPGEAVPDFTLTTQQGDSLQLSDLRDHVVVLTFIFTRCPQPDFCPLMDRKFAELARRLERSPERARRVRLLSVSFDPEYDTPEVLAEHARRLGAEPPGWTFAVADHDELRKVAEPLGLTYAPMTDQILHSLSTAVIAPDGSLLRLEIGNSWRPEDLYGEIRGLLDANGP